MSLASDGALLMRLLLLCLFIPIQSSNTPEVLKGVPTLKIHQRPRPKLMRSLMSQNATETVRLSFWTVYLTAMQFYVNSLIPWDGAVSLLTPTRKTMDHNVSDLKMDKAQRAFTTKVQCPPQCHFAPVFATERKQTFHSNNHKGHQLGKCKLRSL